MLFIGICEDMLISRYIYGEDIDGYGRATLAAYAEMMLIANMPVAREYCISSRSRMIE